METREIQKVNGLTQEEAYKSLEEFKRFMNFNEYGSPTDRIELFKIWCEDTLKLDWKEASRWLKENR